MCNIWLGHRLPSQWYHLPVQSPDKITSNQEFIPFMDAVLMDVADNTLFLTHETGTSKSGGETIEYLGENRSLALILCFYFLFFRNDGTV